MAANASHTQPCSHRRGAQCMQGAAGAFRTASQAASTKHGRLRRLGGHMCPYELSRQFVQRLQTAYLWCRAVLFGLRLVAMEVPRKVCVKATSSAGVACRSIERKFLPGTTAGRLGNRRACVQALAALDDPLSVRRCCMIPSAGNINSPQVAGRWPTAPAACAARLTRGHLGGG